MGTGPGEDFGDKQDQVAQAWDPGSDCVLPRGSETNSVETQNSSFQTELRSQCGWCIKDKE